MLDQTSPSLSRASWKNSPPEGALVPVGYVKSFTPSEVAALSQGFLPREMEDRWFIFREGDSLFFHRSWTGLFVFRVDLRVHPDNSAEVLAAFADSAHPGALETLQNLVRFKLLRETEPEKASLWRRFFGA